MAAAIGYAYSIYQVEYSRNLIFASGAVMERTFVIERPRWNLTIFKVNFGLLALKGYTKGEHVLRFEAIVHNTRTLHTGRVLEKFRPSSPGWPAWPDLPTD